MMHDPFYTEQVPNIERLKRTITARPVKGGLKLRIGSSVKYAAPHEFGTRRKQSLQGGTKA